MINVESKAIITILRQGLPGLEHFNKVWGNDEDLIEAINTRHIDNIPDAVGWAYEEEMLIQLFKTNPKLAELLEITLDRAYHIKHHGKTANLKQYSLT